MVPFPVDSARVVREMRCNMYDRFVTVARKPALSATRLLAAVALFITLWKTSGA